MRNYLITYSWPEKYRGSYLISAEDGIEASNKLSSFLKEKYGATNTSNSIVTEVIGDSIQLLVEQGNRGNFIKTIMVDRLEGI